LTTALTTPLDTATAVADLVLVRMALPSKRPVGPSALRRDVGKLLKADLSAAEFDDLRNDLAAAGFLTKGNRNMFALTESGRERALRFLGATELPARANWSTIITKFLFPKAAGLTPDAADKLDTGDKLAAFILKQKYDLATAPGSTVNQAVEAVACKQLGFPDETSLDGLMCAVLSRLMGTERLTKEILVKQLPVFETGLTTTDIDAVRQRVISNWLGEMPHRTGPAAPPSVEPFDLHAFAATVRALAASSPPEDRFADNKVFIAALWRASQGEPNFPQLALAEFKQHLVDANSQGLLHLSHGDFEGDVDPELVAESETESSNATLHFVLLEAAGP